MKNIAIQVENMSKSFKVYYDKANTLKEKLMFWKRSKGEVREVLKDINLTITKGETVALVGTNGCGKSTLLKLMTKIIYPTKGKIKTNGTLTSLLELGAGFHPDFTGRENIYFNASIFGLTKKEIDNRIDKIIGFSELGEFIDNPIRTYSSGMYMRLAFSIAINVDAEILLIDEILAVGDQHFTDKCYKKLEELRDSDKTIVIVSHSLDIVKKLCNRAVWIYNGRVKADGNPNDVIDEYLNQIAIDHKEKKKKNIESGLEKYTGKICIDTPKDRSRVKKGTKKIEVVGWELSDCENSRFEIRVNGKVVKNIKRVERDDVYNSFSEQYPGYLDSSKLGFSFNIDVAKINDEYLVVEAISYDENNEIICETKISLEVER